MNKARAIQVGVAIAVWALTFVIFTMAPVTPPSDLCTLAAPRPTSSALGTNVVLLPIAKKTGNILSNPSLEMPEGSSCVWWYYDWRGWNGPTYGCYQEQRPAHNWTAWWYENDPEQCPPWRSGRPEVLVLEKIVDPRRVLDGGGASKGFTFWRCQHQGLLQRVEVTPGHYRLEAWAHGWYSECSTRPYDPPYGADCSTPLNWAHMTFRAGIDPLGGVDPRAARVIWSDPVECYGAYCRLSVEADLGGGTVTVFLESKTTHALKHEDAYWDKASLALR